MKTGYIIYKIKKLSKYCISWADRATFTQYAVVDNKTGDPTKVLLKDRFTQLIILGWWIAFFVVIYI